MHHVVAAFASLSMVGAISRPFVPTPSSRAAVATVSSQPSLRSYPLMAKAHKDVRILKKFSWQVATAGVVSAVVLRRLSTVSVPPLFAWHVMCMAPVLPLGAASISTVRQRLRPPPGTTNRKQRAEWLVIRHFMAAAAALYIAAAGIVSIWLHKQSIGRAHLTTVHSWLGVATWLTWLAAYLIAQPQVWKEQWKARKFSLWSNKRWLWASPSHRQAGTLAFVTSLAAYCSGMLGWAALDRRTSLACVAAVLAVAMGVLNDRSATEAAQAVRAVAATPVRITRRAFGLGRAGPPAMMSYDAEETIDPAMRERLEAMQAQNQRNGAVALGLVVVICVWFFSVPPDIRRTSDPASIWPRVVEHYSTCGGSGEKCIQFDFTIDPDSVAAFNAAKADVVDQLVSGGGP